MGLRDRYRGLCLIKNREGEPDKYIPMNFFGEIGLWEELPKAEEISDFSIYAHLVKEDVNNNSEEGLINDKVIYKF